MLKNVYDRIVIGGGLFGAYASLVLARKGYKVCLVEQNSGLLERASFINQARLHTGLHYPRSIDTALETIRYSGEFKNRFPTAIRDFDQIYAISKYGSKTSSDDFRNFINRAGIEAQEIVLGEFFNSSSVSSAFRVVEPSFDSTELRRILTREINESSRISLSLDSQVIGGRASSAGVELKLANGAQVFAEGLVISAYAGINGLRQSLGLDSLPLTFEIADVFLGRVGSKYSNVGFTVMDGPFWSMMPFGNSEFSSLTSVGLTPIEKSRELPLFACQSRRVDCTPLGLANCNECSFKPKSNYHHILQQVSLHLKENLNFTQTSRMTTVKAILTTSDVDDSRPTLIQRENNIWTIFSGKITTIFDIEENLS